MTTKPSGLPPVKRIKKSRVIIFVLLLLALYGVSFFYSKRETPKAPETIEYAETGAGLMESNLLKLPDSYADIKRPPKVEPVPEIKPEPKIKVKAPEIKPKPEPAPAPVPAPAPAPPVVTKDEDEEKALNSAISFELPAAKNIQTVPGQVKKTASVFALGTELRASGSVSNQLYTGTIIPAALITGINSDLPGNIVAQVSSNVYDSISGTTLLIPQGTRLWGSYDSQVNWGAERLQIEWYRLILPNGKTLYLGEKGMSGTDLSGMSGVKDRINRHWGRQIGAVLLSTFLSAGTAITQGNVPNNPLSLGQNITDSVTDDVNRAGQKVVAERFNVNPTIEIRPGHLFNVMVSKDIVLPEYKPLETTTLTFTKN